MGDNGIGFMPVGFAGEDNPGWGESPTECVVTGELCAGLVFPLSEVEVVVRGDTRPMSLA
jgi:hypothetical protein